MQANTADLTTGWGKGVHETARLSYQSASCSGGREGVGEIARLSDQLYQRRQTLQTSQPCLDRRGGGKGGWGRLSYQSASCCTPLTCCTSTREHCRSHNHVQISIIIYCKHNHQNNMSCRCNPLYNTLSSGTTGVYWGKHSFFFLKPYIVGTC